MLIGFYTPSDIAYMSGTRSAALRKLNQYEDCLKDIARAAKFGYPKASIYKLWERKGKCYEVELQTRVHKDFTIIITEKASTRKHLLVLSFHI